MVKRVVEGFGIKLYAACTVSEADQILHTTRLDLAICDFDVPRADELGPASAFQSMARRHRRPDAAARLDQSRHKRVQLRVPKPVSVDMLVRSLKASYTNMAQQRIATYRHTVPVNQFPAR